MGLFSIGVVLVAIAIIRLPIYRSRTSQLNRNTWGSVEEFAAALVANTPTLFSLRRRRVPIDNVSFQNTSYSSKAGFTQVLEEGSDSLVELEPALGAQTPGRSNSIWREVPSNQT